MSETVQSWVISLMMFTITASILWCGFCYGVLQHEHCAFIHIIHSLSCSSFSYPPHGAGSIYRSDPPGRTFRINLGFYQANMSIAKKCLLVGWTSPANISCIRSFLGLLLKKRKYKHHSLDTILVGFVIYESQ